VLLLSHFKSAGSVALQPNGLQHSVRVMAVARMKWGRQRPPAVMVDGISLLSPDGLLPAGHALVTPVPMGDWLIMKI
jgi:hypothetical protein